MSRNIHAEAGAALRAWLQRVLHATVAFTEHGKRFTVITNDVTMALKHLGV